MRSERHGVFLIPDSQATDHHVDQWCRLAHGRNNSPRRVEMIVDTHRDTHRNNISRGRNGVGKAGGGHVGTKVGDFPPGLADEIGQDRNR